MSTAFPPMFLTRPLTRADWVEGRVYVCGCLQYGLREDAERFVAAHGGGFRAAVEWEVREALALWRGYREPIAAL